MSITFESMSTYLGEHSILTLATINSDGQPVLDTVDYMWTGKSLFFFTDGRTRKAKNITNNATIYAIVADQSAEFFSAKSVEITGQAKLTEDPAQIGMYMQNFMSRRPQFTEIPPSLDMQANMRVYEVIPTKLRMLDNTVAPGTIEEITL